MPCGHIVQITGIVFSPYDLHFFSLGTRFFPLSDERGVPKNVGLARNFWDREIPVQGQRVAVDNMRRYLDWQTVRGLPDTLRELLVRLVIHQEHRCFCNASGPPTNLKTVKLINRQPLLNGYIHSEGTKHPLAPPDLLDQISLNPAQLPVSNDQEVPRTTSRIKEHVIRQRVPELLQRLNRRGLVPDQPTSFRTNLIQEKSVEHLQNVLF